MFAKVPAGNHAHIVSAWLTTIRRAMSLGLQDDAYRLTVGYVRRLRELGLLC